MLLRTPTGLVAARDTAVHIACQTFYTRSGWGMRATCFEATVRTDDTGAFGMEEPPVERWTGHQRGRSVIAVYLNVTAPDGYVAPAPLKVEHWTVFAPLEIPTRVYRHENWVSIPGPEGERWPRDASNRWATPTLVLEPAVTVRGGTRDPDGRPLPHALVSCAWSHGGFGERRVGMVSDGRGGFAFDVPASAAQVQLRLHLRPARQGWWTPEPDAQDPARAYPWPGTPSASVAPGTAGVVLQAEAASSLTGRLVTPSGAAPAAGTFDVWPAPPSQWPVGYDAAGERRYRSSQADDGGFEIEGLPTGRWVVQFRETVADGQAPRMGWALLDTPAEGVRILCRRAYRLAWTPRGLPADEGAEAGARGRGRRRRRGEVQYLQSASTSASERWWEDATTPLLWRFHENERSGVRDALVHGWRQGMPGVLFISRDDGLCALVPDVTPGPEPTEVLLVPGGTIAGRIDRHHELGYLERHRGTQVEARRGHLVRRAKVDSNGDFWIRGLPHGRWDLCVVGEHVWTGNARTRKLGVPTGTEDLVLHAR